MLMELRSDEATCLILPFDLTTISFVMRAPLFLNKPVFRVCRLI